MDEKRTHSSLNNPLYEICRVNLHRNTFEERENRNCKRLFILRSVPVDYCSIDAPFHEREVQLDHQRNDKMG